MNRYLTRRRRDGDRLATAVAALIWIVIFTVILGLVTMFNLWRADGDWGCVMSRDPALCVAVKGADR